MTDNTPDAAQKYERINDAHFGRHNGFACRLERAGRAEWAAHFRWKSNSLWMRRHEAYESARQSTLVTIGA